MGKTAALLPTWPYATWDWIEITVMLSVNGIAIRQKG